jgi:hypothetical protein
LLLMSEHHQRNEGSHFIFSSGSRLASHPGPVSRTYLDVITAPGRRGAFRPRSAPK